MRESYETIRRLVKPDAILDEDGVGRVGAAGNAMLVTCTRCETLHPPMQPLAFHPVCTACALYRLPR